MAIGIAINDTGCVAINDSGCLGRGECARNTDPCTGAPCRKMRFAILGSANYSSPATWNIDVDNYVNITENESDGLVSLYLDYDCAEPSLRDLMTRLPDGRWAFAYGDGTLTTTSSSHDYPPASDGLGVAWENTVDPAAVAGGAQPDSVYNQNYCFRGTYPTYPSGTNLYASGVIGTLLTTTQATISVWNSITIYNPPDACVVGSTVYQCIAPNTNQLPPNVLYWSTTTRPVLSAVLTPHPTISDLWSTATGALLLADGTYLDYVNFSYTTNGGSEPVFQIGVPNPFEIALGQARWYANKGRISDPHALSSVDKFSHLPRFLYVGASP